MESTLYFYVTGYIICNLTNYKEKVKEKKRKEMIEGDILLLRTIFKINKIIKCVSVVIGW